MKNLCSACGTALALSGQRTEEDGVLKEWYVCRCRDCARYGKPQGWRASEPVPAPQQDNETKMARAAYAARMRMKRRR